MEVAVARGLGKLQRKILDVLESDKLAQLGGLDTTMLAERCGLGVKPGPSVEHGESVQSDRTDFAVYTRRLKSLRRALRGLRHRGLVVAVSGIDEDSRAQSYMLRNVAERLKIEDAV